MAVSHKDTDNLHIHFITTRIGIEGKVYDTTFVSNKASRIAGEISRDMGLTIARDVNSGKQYPKKHSDPTRLKALETIQYFAYTELNKGHRSINDFMQGISDAGVGFEYATNKKGEATIYNFTLNKFGFV